MADIIGYSESGLSKLTNDLNAKKDQISSVTVNIKSSMDRVESSWKGIDATLFTNKMRDDYVFLLKKYTTSLASYIKFINEAKKEYKKHDETFASKKIDF